MSEDKEKKERKPKTPTEIEVVCDRCGRPGGTLVKKSKGVYVHQTQAMCSKAKEE